MTPARLELFETHRPQLLCTAFRIVGSDSDAEDVVQEAWIRYERADPREIRNPGAWLTTVTTRLCLDLLRGRREVPRQPADLVPVGDERDPGAVAALADEVTDALVVVVRELTPPQRVALVLHEVFGMSFGEVAAVLDTTTGSARKLASRARDRLRRRAPEPPQEQPGRTREVVEAFLRAAQDGDTDALAEVLDPDVVRTADPQALAPGGPQFLRGARTVIEETRTLRSSARQARVATVGGRPVIVVESNGAVRSVLVVHVGGGRVVRYDVVADPRRLALLESGQVFAEGVRS
ncbi:sigma-70 family RNA polymerase sigma factor [Saccharomonospora xinjiangensis]|uniref:sigma-70 family RNA polymerase sigma factor n=1 Tax=Saccharomonospora xinjiangensis TaxID=75294 RepID=UPI0010C36AE1|nr:sigma-70 family RNA polymerase sigma factor [Saccharomonospora xinjiangensis]QBQ59704.1 ECF RNA polymerase sigma factor SigJ [Saccharomonospora xinjiangensis]